MAERYKAEELLSDELSKEQWKEADPDQRLLAGRIRTVLMSSGNERLGEGEKSVLWKRIERTTRQGFTRRFPVWRAAAAILLLLLSLGILFRELRRPEEELARMQLAARMAEDDGSGTVQVIAPRPSAATGKSPDRLVYKTIVVPYGQRSEITLSDGSRIWLNSGSKLVYPLEFENSRRSVYLQGEAYFAIAHDRSKPFLVKTDDLEVRVLGTSFNVSAYPDESKSEVTLVEGSIELQTYHQDLIPGAPTRLVPNETAVYYQEDHRLDVSAIAHAEQVTAWRTGVMTFENSPLEDVLKKLERYYHADILLLDATAGKQTYSGSLDLQRGLDKVMELVSVMTKLHVDKQEERRFVLK